MIEVELEQKKRKNTVAQKNLFSKNQLPNIIELTQEDQSKIQYRSAKDKKQASQKSEQKFMINQNKNSITQIIKSYFCCIKFINFFRRNKNEIKLFTQKDFIKQIKNLKLKPTQYILPPQVGPQRKTLVLDLDETLIHSSFDSSDYDLKFKFTSENKTVEVFTNKRFGIDYFLNEMSKYYQIIIFTAGLKQYAENAINLIDPKKKISYRIYRQHCTFINKIYLKNLNILNRKLKNIVLLDNSKNAGLLQPENLLLVQSFFNNKKDRELIRILPFLKHLATQQDVRPIARKRNLFQQKQIIIKQATLFNQNNNTNVVVKKKKHHQKRNSDMEQLVKRDEQGAQSDTKLTHLR